MKTNTVKAIVLALVANAITLATTFGLSVSPAKEDAILAFVGTITTAAAGIYAWHESHKIAAATARAVAPAPLVSVAEATAPPVPPPAAA